MNIVIILFIGLLVFSYLLLSNYEQSYLLQAIHIKNAPKESLNRPPNPRY